MLSSFNVSAPSTLQSTPTRSAHAGGKLRRTAPGALFAKASAKTLIVALAAAGPGLASALTTTCYWVGEVYRQNLNNGQFDAGTYTWGDALAWSMFSSGNAGTCLGGTPNNGSIQYDVVIADANAPALLGNAGQKSEVLVDKNDVPISPTLSKLTLSNSYLGANTLHLTALVADGSEIVGGNVIVNGSQGSSSLNNMAIPSTTLTFSGPGSVAQITGTLALSRNHSASGRTGSPLVGAVPALAVSSGATLNFNNATVYGSNLAAASEGTIHAQPGSVIGLYGSNSFLGASLAGEFDASSGSSTIFTKTTNQGSLNAPNQSAISFNNGFMTQLAGAAAPGFSQTGTGSIKITDLSALTGYFSGIVHLAGDGLGGTTFDNTLSGITVKPGGTLSFDSGSTSFSGSNRGTLSVQRATLQLVGSSSNDGGSLDNLAGGKVVISGSFANQRGSSLSNSSSLEIEHGVTLNNPGSLTNLARGVASNLGTIDNAGVLDNELGATLTNNGRLANKGNLVNAGRLDGTGTFTQSAGSSRIDGHLKQVSITISGGSLFGTGMVTGATTLDGGLVQGGSSGVAGTLAIEGSFVQHQGGTWQAWVGGVGSGQYSALSIDGDASLGGTLQIVTGKGFSFAAGQSFKIATISAGTLGGSFDRLVDGSFSGRGDELVIGNGLELKVLYGNDDIQLEVLAAAVPEPGSWALMLCGGAVVGLLVERRRAMSTRRSIDTHASIFFSRASAAGAPSRAG